MQTQTRPKPRGRPRLDESPLSRERILSTASHLMEEGASDVSMRAVATALGVNAMALYHYFSDKQALKRAMIEEAFAPLFALRPRLARLHTPELKLKLLAATYLHCAARALPLTRHLAVQGGAPLAADFAALFEEALGTPMPSSESTVLRDVLVDYLHGVALAGPAHASSTLEAGWPILMEGVRRHLKPDVEKEGV
jgi:AcrR family transcriptional regulator